MKVRELMTGAPITVGPDTPVFDARQTMLKERIRHLLVTEGTRLVGIVTDRDIRLNLPSQATSLSMWEVNYLLAKLTVDKVMTKGVIITGPDQDAARRGAPSARAQDRRPAGARRRAPHRHRHRDRCPARFRAKPALGAGGGSRREPHPGRRGRSRPRGHL